MLDWKRLSGGILALLLMTAAVIPATAASADILVRGEQPRAAERVGSGGLTGLLGTWMGLVIRIWASDDNGPDMDPNGNTQTLSPELRREAYQSTRFRQQVAPRP